MVKPEGNNDLNSFELFNQRKLYKEQSYPSKESTGVPTPFDLWYEKPLYGRVNQKGNPIVVNQTKLKRIESSTLDVFVLDFVADEFADFRNEFLFLNKQDTGGTEFSSLTPVKGWINAIERREEYMLNLYDLYANTYLSLGNRKSSIMSFRDFLNNFQTFLRDLNGDFPISLSSYYLSSFTSPLSSGIMIEISELSHGSDEEKYEEFLKSPSFSCYAHAAQRHGFKIDKNAPWRLIADLASPFWETKYGLTLDNIIKVYYNETYKQDIKLIKNILGRFYYTFASNNPTFTKSMYSACKEKTVKQVVRRSLISEEQMSADFDDEFWINYYINLMANESPNTITDEEVRKVSSQARNLLKSRGLEEAVNSIGIFFQEKS